MRDKKQSGQSLVELAFVLPAFCFGVLVIVQLLVFCRNELELQRMAQVSSDRVVATTSAGNVLYSLFNRLWGRITPPRLHRTRTVIASWKPFRGVSTIQLPGRFMDLDVSSTLLPSPGFTQTLGLATQAATAVALVEPPLPENAE